MQEQDLSRAELLELLAQRDKTIEDLSAAVANGSAMQSDSALKELKLLHRITRSFLSWADD